MNREQNVFNKIKNIFSFRWRELNKNKEIFQNVCQNSKFKAELIYSNSISSDWLTNHDYEYVFLLKGKAYLSDMNNNLILMKKGDILAIKKSGQHKIIKTSRKTIWLAIHFQNKGEIYE
ncbi:hypothetical protein, partial [Mycoplasmopsis columbina]|uniref:hypothetical protein n=1 Tax=Mycoplasmopsis columbina TaxID=114881 RepID=UPI0004A72A94